MARDESPRSRLNVPDGPVSRREAPGLAHWLLGKRLSSDDEAHEQIGPVAGIPVLGLDALSSAAYGPEAALTLLLPLGLAGLSYILPISALIIAILAVVFFSYRQTIHAYPGGGGSYTVAKENLGERSALLAGAALALDYVLNVAVGLRVIDTATAPLVGVVETTVGGALRAVKVQVYGAARALPARSVAPVEIVAA